MTVIDSELPAAPSSLAATSTRSPVHLSSHRGRIACLALGIVLAGLGLRLWCAQGPLWLDEIWSVENLAPLDRFWQVFWRISHDNNHFLNSLWLYFAVQFHADELALRAPSIVAGVLTVAMAMRLASRHSAAAAMAAAAMTATSYFFVNYSVEARGYAGMALCIAVAFEALEAAIARPDSRARLAFAAAGGIGLLCHFAMLPVIALFVAIFAAEQRRRAENWKFVADATIHFAAPTLAAATPALAFVLAGVFVVGRFTIGGVREFDALQAREAIAEMIRDTLGLSATAPTALVIAASIAVVLAALHLRLVMNGRTTAYVVILLALPLAVFGVRPPNAHIPRYYLVCAFFLVLLLAEIFGSLWQAGRWSRFAALVALAAIVSGNVNLLIRYQKSRETDWTHALAEIAASGSHIVGSNFDDRVGKLVAYYDRSHPALDLVPRADWCATPPQWFIAEVGGIADAPKDLDLSGGACRIRFDFVRRYESWGLSKIDWALYRAR